MFCCSSNNKVAIRKHQNYLARETNEKEEELRIQSEKDALFVAELNSLPHWKPVKSVPGATLSWFHPLDSRVIIAKGVAEVNAPASDVVAFLFPQTKEEHGRMVQVVYREFSRDFDFRRQGDKVVWLWIHVNFGLIGIQDREYIVSMRHHTTTDGTHYLLMNNLPRWDKHPHRSDLVRVEVCGTCAYVIRPVTETSCELTYIGMSDMKGWLPAWLMNKVAMTNGKMVLCVREYFEERAQSQRP